MNTYNVDLNNLPEHIAIIMDGNGRWAKQRGLPRTAGHFKGADNLKRITHFCYDIGIKTLTLYAFSTENWKRPQDEVDALFNLFYEKLQDYKALMGDRKAVVRFLGDKKPLSEKLRNKMREIEKDSLKYLDGGFTFNFAINYGSRDEILKATREIAELYKNGDVDLEDINEKLFSNHLYTYGLPDPDLMIRPSGEQRISNFLLWQSAYTEFYYSNVLWPDFSPKMLAEAIVEYQKRNRRYGGV